MSAHAAIATGLATSGANAAYSGNGELFFSVADPVLEVSYTLDLGITMNDFFIQGQPDAGLQRFFVMEDANWTSFIGQVNTAGLIWAVMARDFTGGTALGGTRLFTTLRQGQEGTLSAIDGINPVYTNQDYSTDIAEPRFGTFLLGVNASGTHGASGDSANFARNGSSVNFKADTGAGYFGELLKPRLTDFDVTNDLGKSSWFYYVTRSGGDQTAGVVVDEFDNLGYDGYWGFTFVDPAVDSPYAGKYLLSYTLQAASLTTTQREFANSIGRTEFNGGFNVTRLGAATSNGLEQPTAVFGNRLLGAASAAALTSPVPEPGSALLLMCGLLALGAARKRR